MADFTQVKDRLERAGLDPNSAAWLLKALSPATPSGSGVQIPDTSCAASANPEYINSFTVGPGAITGNWDCLVVKLPAYPLLGYTVVAPAGFNFTTTWTNANVTVTPLVAEPASSATADFTQLFGQSAFASYAQTGAWALLPSTQPIAWRATARSFTEYLVASDLANQGTVTAGQFVPRIQPSQTGFVYGTGPTVNSMYVIDTVEIPLSETNMTAMNPRVRIAPAKTGVYQPIYSAGPTFSWTRARNQPPVFTDADFNTTPLGYPFYWLPGGLAGDVTTAAYVPSLAFCSDPTYALTIGRWLTGNSAVLAYPPVAGNPYTWGLSNEMAGVSIYRGLNPAASITIKSVLALEIIPAPTSPIRQFVQPAPNNDPKALQLYFDLVHDMPQTYPASSNFLGAVLAAAKSLLPMVLPHVSGIIQSAKGVFGMIPGQETTSRGEEQPEMAGSSASRPLQPRAVKVLARPTALRLRASSVASRTSVRSKAPAKKKKAKPRRR